jgi:hypothetical protein
MNRSKSPPQKPYRDGDIVADELTDVSGKLIFAELSELFLKVLDRVLSFSIEFGIKCNGFEFRIDLDLK